MQLLFVDQELIILFLVVALVWRRSLKSLRLCRFK